MESPYVTFLLVINCNYSRICYRFRDIHAFTHPSLFEAPARGNPLECRDEIWRQKTRIVELPDGEEIMTLVFFVLTQYRLVTDRQTDTLRSLLPALA